MNTVSLDAAIAMTGISRRTLWRRMVDGSIPAGEKDARGRATLALEGVLGLTHAHTGVTFSIEDREVLLAADGGDAAAQADVGARLYVAGARSAALYWLRQAAEQGDADAAQWLGTAYVAGGGQEAPNDSLGLMWVAKAAAQGSEIARRQVAALVGRAVGQDGGPE